MTACHEATTGATSRCSEAPDPWLAPWPESGLEPAGECPACAFNVASVWHDSLVDSSFRTAPGRWLLRRCQRCGSGYLDPRPTAATLHRAYARYYTHDGSEQQASQARGWMPWFRAVIINSYVNHRFGAHRSPASPWGLGVAMLLSLHRSYWNRLYRHLPRPRAGANMLLDVGCGNGDFLTLASGCGWNACGLDLDPRAIALATKRGLSAQQGDIGLLTDQQERFDVITLSHVIEHVHAPRQLLNECLRLLKPGGLLWLETPNVESIGHRYFGPHWRGLEVPRHLTVFSWRGLGLALEAAGFGQPVALRVPSSLPDMFRQSIAMKAGGPADVHLPMPAACIARALIGRLIEQFQPMSREFITLTVRRHR